jgi:hypothetical protein
MIDILGWAISGLLVVITVIVHYDVMLNISDRLLPWAQQRLRGRRVMILIVVALMLGHIAEIWLFAFSYHVMLGLRGFGTISGGFDGDLNSLLYFSAVNYTSLADNHLHPEGALRYLAASETLAGMIMITWSASFTFIKMEQIWKTHRSKHNAGG